MNIDSSRLDGVIQLLERYHTKILYLCEDVPAAVRQEPSLPDGWSIKDVLAHLAAWNWRYVFLLVAAQNRDWPLKARPDVEGLNHEFYQERLDWSWAEAETDFRRSHQALTRAIEQLPQERKESALVQQTIIKGAAGHYLVHLSDLERWHRDSVVPLTKRL